MSLISAQGATDTVTVILRTMGRDSRNARVPVEVGRVLCSGRLQVSTASDVERYSSTGVAVSDTSRFTTPEFPGDDISQVITPDGVTHDVVGRPQRRRASRMTTHDIVLLTAQAQRRDW